MAGHRGANLSRVLRLAAYLRRFRYMPPPYLLAERFGVCQRTIYRDLAALREARWPLPISEEGVRVIW